MALVFGLVVDSTTCSFMFVWFLVEFVFRPTWSSVVVTREQSDGVFAIEDCWICDTRVIWGTRVAPRFFLFFFFLDHTTGSEFFSCLVKQILITN